MERQGKERRGNGERWKEAKEEKKKERGKRKWGRRKGREHPLIDTDQVDLSDQPYLNPRSMNQHTHRLDVKLNETTGNYIFDEEGKVFVRWERMIFLNVFCNLFFLFFCFFFLFLFSLNVQAEKIDEEMINDWTSLDLQRVTDSGLVSNHHTFTHTYVYIAFPLFPWGTQSKSRISEPRDIWT